MKLQLLLALLMIAHPTLSSGMEGSRILIVVGPSTHPPGTHEVAACGRLLKHCLETAAHPAGVRAEVVTDWPSDSAALRDVRSVVFFGDTFPPQRMTNTAAILTDLDTLTGRGVGMVALHYAVGLRGEDMAADGDHPLLHWIGGYFADRNHPRHTSVARVFPSATIEPAAPGHPVSRGWSAFTLHDEPYYNNYFGPHDNQPATNVTILATAMLPPDAPQREAVAWGVERADGGRGFGIVMPHFYRNWEVEDLRRFILNGIVWTAKLEVPVGGVQTMLPDLEAFLPDSIEPQPRR